MRAAPGSAGILGVGTVEPVAGSAGLTVDACWFGDGFVKGLALAKGFGLFVGFAAAEL